MVTVKGGAFIADIDSKRVVFHFPSGLQKNRTVTAGSIAAVRRLPNGHMNLVVRHRRDLVVPVGDDAEYRDLSTALNRLISDFRSAEERRKREARRAKLERDRRTVNKSTALWWCGKVGGRRG